MPKPVLVTIGVSHYCEKARWALERANVGFVEKPHAPLLHYAATVPVHRQKSTPLLITSHGHVRDSKRIVLHADGFLSEGARLFPGEGSHRAEVEELCALFDDKLGPATRRLAYFHLLDDLDQATATITARLPAVEARAFSLLRGPIVKAMRRGLGIDAAGAAKSEARLTSILDDIDRRLADGRSYLAGDRFTAADLTFAALLAPALLPPGYGWPLPSRDEAPAGARALVDQTRARPSGAFALRIYEKHRGERASS